MIENKKNKITVELTDEQIIQFAKLDTKRFVYTQSILLIESCKEWVAANPPPPKMRPMTDKEKIEWACDNLDKKISTNWVTVEGSTMISEHVQVQDYTFGQIIRRHKYLDIDNKEHKFEVPE